MLIDANVSPTIEVDILKVKPKEPHKKYGLNSECYLLNIPIPRSNNVAAYFQLKSIVLKVNPPAAKLLERLKNGPIEKAKSAETDMLENLARVGVVNVPTEKLPRAAITLSSVPDRCNQNSLYCHGKSETTDDLMSMYISRAAVNKLAENTVSMIC